jgi:hypothetical protein
MGVDYYWKRMPPSAVEGLDGEALQALIPGPEALDFPAQRDTFWLIGTEHGGLILTLLAAGAETERQMAAVELFGAQTANWDEEWLAGTMPPEHVLQVANFLEDAPIEEWMRTKADVLELEAEQMGWHYDDRMSIIVLEAIQDLTQVFQFAGERGEAMIVSVRA